MLKCRLNDLIIEGVGLFENVFDNLGSRNMRIPDFVFMYFGQQNIPGNINFLSSLFTTVSAEFFQRDF
jgi:hypothetical protein